MRLLENRPSASKNQSEASVVPLLPLQVTVPLGPGALGSPSTRLFLWFCGLLAWNNNFWFHLEEAQNICVWLLGYHSFLALQISLILEKLLEHFFLTLNMTQNTNKYILVNKNSGGADGIHGPQESCWPKGVFCLAMLFSQPEEGG